MIQLAFPFPRDWHEARVAEAEKRCLDAIKGHKKRIPLYDRVKFYRTAQLRHELSLVSKTDNRKAAA